MATMTVVLVHGNPETEASATYLGYRDWLEHELAQIDDPVDLVGHDWGGGHVVNAVMHRPELVRSWASDAVGLFDTGYVWHDLAQVWQTPPQLREALRSAADGDLSANVPTASELRGARYV